MVLIAKHQPSARLVSFSRKLEGHVFGYVVNNARTLERASRAQRTRSRVHIEWHRAPHVRLLTCFLLKQARATGK